MDEQLQADDRQLVRLWREVAPHPVDEEDVAQYVELRRREGLPAAKEAFPAVFEHLVTSCASCAELVSEVDSMVAQEIAAETFDEHPSKGWLPALWRAFYVAHPLVTDQAAPPIADASPLDEPSLADPAAPAVDTLVLTVRGSPDLAVELTPHGDGIAVHLRRRGAGEPSSRTVDNDLAGWRIRAGALGPAGATIEAATNQQGATLLHGLAWDDIRERTFEVQAPA